MNKVYHDPMTDASDVHIDDYRNQRVTVSVVAHMGTMTARRRAVYLQAIGRTIVTYEVVTTDNTIVHRCTSRLESVETLAYLADWHNDGLE